MSFLSSKPGSGGGGVTDINGLTGAVTLSAGNNVTLNESGNDIEITANFTQEGKYMISGGITWSGTGLTYDVSFLNYFFNGNKTANPTQVTLAASDPTNNRFDAIVVDEAGTVTAITGTPSANPEVPAIPEDQLQVTIILVAAGSTTPTIASEEIYMDDPTTGWTFSTYDAAAPATGTINFAGTSSPKQGTECIEASTDLRRGARFVRGTSFDAFQYTMLQVWVRFTGTAVATNKSLNVRFENSAGTLVANTVNLFSYGLQRGVLNTWQLVVVPITAFGALPSTVKGLKMIMAGGTVGVVRQWDIDYMILTNGSIPSGNVPTITFAKNGTNIAAQSGLNLIEGTGVTITGVNDPTNNRVNYTLSAAGGGSPGGSTTQIQYNNAGAFAGSSDFTWDNTNKTFITGDTSLATNKIVFTVDDNGKTVNIKKNSVDYFNIDFNTGINKTTLFNKTVEIKNVATSILLDATQIKFNNSYSFPFTDGTSGQALVTDGAGTLSFATPTASASLTSTYVGYGDGSNALTGSSNFIWNETNKILQVGDLANSYTGTTFKLNDNTASMLFNSNSDSSIFKVTLGSGNKDVIIADYNTNSYSIGNKTLFYLELRSGSQGFKIVDGSNTYGVGILGNTGNGTTTIGDVLNIQNSTKVIVNDSTQRITLTNVPTYADETTAIGAGLTTGQVYKSYDGQNYFLAIVH